MPECRSSHAGRGLLLGWLDLLHMSGHDPVALSRYISNDIILDGFTALSPERLLAVWIEAAAILPPKEPKRPKAPSSTT